jgi:precorrin-6B methylase 1
LTCDTNANTSHVSALRDPIDLWGWKGLTIVGTGIRVGLQTTPEAKICIEQASQVLYLVGDPVSEAWIQSLRSGAESLFPLYGRDKPRCQTYTEIEDRILENLRRWGDVCVVFYGHPGMLVGPAGEAMRRAREEGFQVRMLPGVSALDNLFSDLGLDPGINGLQTYEATGFLLYRPQLEPTAALVLWQIGALGEKSWSPQAQPKPGILRLLQNRLSEFYPADHPVVVYEAAVLPFESPVVQRTTVSSLVSSTFSTSSTLLVPPCPSGGPDLETLHLLEAGGIPEESPRI